MELDRPVTRAHLPLPPPLGRDDARLPLRPRREDAPGLPPLVVAGVGDMEDLPEREGEAAGWQAIVLLRLVGEQGAGRTRFNQSTKSLNKQNAI